jgi:CRP-like cAMP-binding protein
MLTAEAISDVVLISYPVQQVERLGDEMPAIRKRLFDFLSERVLGMQDHLVMLGRQTAMERVAGFLLLLLQRSAPGRRSAIDLPMSRLDIADYLGLTLETVSRTLADLKHAHVIDLEGPHLAVVRDVEALRSLAEGDENPHRLG